MLAALDAAHGYPPRAPYGRVLSTAAIGQVPYAWVAQTRPGGRVLTPRGNRVPQWRLALAERGRGGHREAIWRTTWRLCGYATNAFLSGGFGNASTTMTKPWLATPASTPVGSPTTTTPRWPSACCAPMRIPLPPRGG
ncbi:MAG: hypothetical protein M3460_05475 [Actinomycetota bacterium]|nr:hypothetical protein [Actinomycetota bacterium]